MMLLVLYIYTLFLVVLITIGVVLNELYSCSHVCAFVCLCSCVSSSHWRESLACDCDMSWSYTLMFITYLEKWIVQKERKTN